MSTQVEGKPARTAEQELRQLVLDLAELRAYAEKLDREWKAVEEAFRQTHAALHERRDLTNRTVSEVEGRVRHLAEIVYRSTKEKRVAAGVSIRVEHTVTVTNEQAALEWAQRTGMALIPARVDVRKLRQFALIDPLPFVKVGEAVKVLIASDLRNAILDSEVG